MMSRLHIVPFVLLLTVVAGCAGQATTPLSPTSTSVSSSASSSPSSPAPAVDPGTSQPTANSGPCVVGFSELQVNGAAFTTQTACGLTIAAAGASWQASTTYGYPAPFVQFVSPAGTTTTGEVNVTAASGTFAFASVDIYSSTTKIPYEITGLAKGAVVFTLASTQNNTFGNFATISSPNAAVPIDTLRIRLTNPSAPCCANPVGLDNIRIVR